MSTNLVRSSILLLSFAICGCPSKTEQSESIELGSEADAPQQADEVENNKKSMLLKKKEGEERRVEIKGVRLGASVADFREKFSGAKCDDERELPREKMKSVPELKKLARKMPRKLRDCRREVEIGGRDVDMLVTFMDGAVGSIELVRKPKEDLAGEVAYWRELLVERYSAPNGIQVDEISQMNKGDKAWPNMVVWGIDEGQVRLKSDLENEQVRVQYMSKRGLAMFEAFAQLAEIAKKKKKQEAASEL